MWIYLTDAVPSKRMTKPTYQPTEYATAFIAAHRSCTSNLELAAKLGMSARSAAAYSSWLRSRGVELKHYKAGSPGKKAIPK